MKYEVTWIMQVEAESSWEAQKKLWAFAEEAEKLLGEDMEMEAFMDDSVEPQPSPSSGR